MGSGLVVFISRELRSLSRCNHQIGAYLKLQIRKCLLVLLPVFGYGGDRKWRQQLAGWLCLFPDRYRQNYCDCLLFVHLLFCNKKPFSSRVCLGIGLLLISVPQGMKKLGKRALFCQWRLALICFSFPVLMSVCMIVDYDFWAENERHDQVRAKLIWFSLREEAESKERKSTISYLPFEENVSLRLPFPYTLKID